MILSVAFLVISEVIVFYLERGFYSMYAYLHF